MRVKKKRIGVLGVRFGFGIVTKPLPAAKWISTSIYKLRVCVSAITAVYAPAKQE